MANATPRKATGHGKGKREIYYPVPAVEGIHPSPLCFAMQNIGERPKKRKFLRRGVEKIEVLGCGR